VGSGEDLFGVRWDGRGENAIGACEVTAAEARASTDLRARVRVASGASDRTIVDLLDGYEAQSTAATRVRRALAADGVDLTTIPERTPDELRAWKRSRQPRLANAMPDGYAIEQCECGRDYPRLMSEATGRCPKCWRKHAGGLQRERDELAAELDSVRQRLADKPLPARRG
jgi:hypothetical protein